MNGRAACLGTQRFQRELVVAKAYVLHSICMQRFIHRLVAPLLPLVLGAALSFGIGAPAQAADWVVSSAPMAEPAEVPPPPEGWQSASGPFVRVHGAPHQYATVLRLARHASEALPRLALELGVPIGDTVHIYMAPTDAEFREMQPGRAPSWADATAYPRLGVVFMRGPGARSGMDEPLEQVLDHELVHILLGRAFAPAVVPDWVQEGVAQVMAKQNGPHTAQTIARGTAFGGPIPLAQLTRAFPADPNRAQLAYAQSADLIEWLRVNYGADVVQVLVAELAAGRSVDGAMYKATGLFLPDVEAAYHATLSSGLPLSLSWTTSTDALFGVAGLLLVVAGIARRRRFHRRLAEMEAEEALVDELIAAMRADREGAYGRLSA